MNARTAWALVALIALTIGAAAQERPTTTEKPRFDGGKNLVDEWADKPHVDPDEAFERVRGAIPVLEKAEVPEKIYVDEEELYERKLAMYEGEAFHKSLRKYSDEDEEDAGAAHVAPKAMPPQPEKSNLLLFVALGFLSICALGYALKR